MKFPFFFELCNEMTFFFLLGKKIDIYIRIKEAINEMVVFVTYKREK